MTPRTCVRQPWHQAWPRCGAVCRDAPHQPAAETIAAGWRDAGRRWSSANGARRLREHGLAAGGAVRDGRGRAASDNGRGFVD